MRRVLLLAALAGCSATTAIDPGDSTAEIIVGGNRLTLSLHVSTQDLKAGQPDTLRATLANAGATDVQLNFGSGCQILPYIRAANGTIVLPSGGAWGCTEALTTLTVPAHSSVVREWIWTGGTVFAPETPVVPLPDGTYSVSVALRANGVALETPAVPIRLRN